MEPSYTCTFCLKFETSDYKIYNKHVDKCSHRFCSICMVNLLEDAVSHCDKCFGLCDIHTNKHSSFCFQELRFFKSEEKTLHHVVEGYDPNDPLGISRINSIQQFFKDSEPHLSILVRSPPYSGKTAFSILLEKFLLSRSKKKVYWISFAELKFNATDEELEAFWIKKLGLSWKAIFSNLSPQIIIMDETQKIYNPYLAFWLYFKDGKNPQSHLQLFCFSAYGDENIFSTISSPIGFSKYFGIEILLLQDEEFDEIISLYNNNPSFTVKIGKIVADCLKLSTKGHIGFLKKTFFYIHDEFKDKISKGGIDDVTIYNNLFSVRYINVIEQSRALPQVEFSNEETYKKIALDVCFKGRISVKEPEKNYAEILNKIGYLYQNDDRSYSIPSPLIKSIIIRRIYGTSRTPIADLTFRNLLITAVKRLDVNELKHKELSITSEGDLCERVWQLEFYKAASSCLPFEYWIHPDVGYQFNLNAYLDFYINSILNWGVELMRLNKNLEEHVGRITNKNYKEMFAIAKNEDLSIPDPRFKGLVRKEWKVLNFIPEDFDRKILEGLWNVVYSNDFKKFTIYGDDGNIIEVINK